MRGVLLLLAAGVTPLQAQLVVTTVAGNSYAFRGDGGPATQAQLSQIYHAITDPQGNVYVADRTNHQVVRISTAGILTVVAGNGIEGFSGDTGRARSAALSFPAAVALDTAGNLYIADAGNYR
ncbi:MAG: protein kinase domain-containing protein, partial [Bryobacteraceae bacterium]